MAVEIIPVRGMPEIEEGDDLARSIVGALRESPGGGPAPVGGADVLVDGDVIAVAQKIVSKAEGRVVALADVVPGERALAMAAESGKDASLLELVLRETRAVVRWTGRVLISETHHGFVCANAGVDRSNAGAPDSAVLLPVDPDASAVALRARLRETTGADVAVVITDTFGRAWREGHANVAIGIAGLPALRRYAGQQDPHGYELRVTEIAVADEIAAAAELVMGKLDRTPAAIVRGLRLPRTEETAREYVRSAARDLFR